MNTGLIICLDVISMYLLYQRSCSDYLIETISKWHEKQYRIEKCSIEYFNDTPYIVGKQWKYVEDYTNCKEVFNKIIVLYNFLLTDKLSLRRNYLSASLLGSPGYVKVYSLGRLDICEYDHTGNLVRLMLLLYIDPQMFIVRMENKIKKLGHNHQVFFEDWQTSINALINKPITGYLVLRTLLIDDLVKYIMNVWIYVEMDWVKKCLS